MMDALTLVLALVVTVAVVGQFLLIVWGNHFRELDQRQLAEARARLVEAAADRQLQTQAQHSRNLGNSEGDQ